MGIAALIFTILGLMAIIYTLFFGNWILGVIGIVVGIWMIISLYQGTKNIAAGILGILFTGIISGILYLCWDGERLGE